MKEMQLYTIMPLFADRVDEVCEDIKYQYKNGIANCALFSMTLVPEGNPPVNKAQVLCKKYDLFKTKLDLPNVIHLPGLDILNGSKWLSEDMVHPNARGVEELAKNLIKKLQNTYKNKAQPWLCLVFIIKRCFYPLAVSFRTSFCTLCKSS